MAFRLVVSLTWRPPAATEGDGAVPIEQQWHELSGRLLERATALGGRIVGWNFRGLSVDFAADGLQDAVDFLVGEPANLELSCGFCHGELQTVSGGARIALVTGEALGLSEALAGYARTGEVLVSPQLVRAAHGELLTLGEPPRRENRDPVSALMLDIVHPLRSLLDEAVARVGEPEFQGPEPSASLPERGCVFLVRGSAGSGGTRVLRELSHGRDDALLVRPGRVGAPLDALLQALEVEGAPPPCELNDMLRARGIAIVAVDDVESVDADTLEFLAARCDEGALGVVLRVDEGAPVPAAFQSAENSGVRDLAPVTGAAGLQLATTATRGELAEELRRSLGTAPSALPLSVMERLTDALESGDWVWSEDGLRLRSAESETEEHPAEYWVERRFRRLHPEAALALEAGLVWGGRVDTGELAKLLSGFEAEREAATGPEWGGLRAETSDIDGWLERLTSARWLCDRHIQSATHSSVIRSLTDEQRRLFLHAAAASELARRSDWSSRASAVTHAALAGDLEWAQELAGSLVPQLYELGLSATAEAFAELAARGDVTVLQARGLVLPEQASPSAPDSIRPVSRASVVAPEHEIPVANLTHDFASLPEEGEPEELLSEADLDEIEVQPDSTGLRQARAAAEAARSVGEDADSIFPKEMAAAVARRDAAALEQMAQAMRQREHTALALRLEAMANLARGEAGVALRELRAARAKALSEPPSQQCRAALALAVGLAASGRPQEAFLEGVFGLARAREAADQRGERACARFLGQLSRSLGEAQAAACWEGLFP